MISIINVKGLTPNKPGVTYVGRDWNGWNRSPLANDNHIGRDGSRSEVIEKYKVWLREQYRLGGAVKIELDMLSRKYSEGQNIVLGCWCTPEPCHAEFIRDAIIGIANSWKRVV